MAESETQGWGTAISGYFLNVHMKTHREGSAEAGTGKRRDSPFHTVTSSDSQSEWYFVILLSAVDFSLRQAGIRPAMADGMCHCDWADGCPGSWQGSLLGHGSGQILEGEPLHWWAE